MNVFTTEDLEYIGLRRVWHKEANTPLFKGMINDEQIEVYIKGKGKLELKKGTSDVVLYTGVTRENLIELTGFKEPHASEDN